MIAFNSLLFLNYEIILQAVDAQRNVAAINLVDNLSNYSLNRLGNYEPITVINCRKNGVRLLWDTSITAIKRALSS